MIELKYVCKIKECITWGHPKRGCTFREKTHNVIKNCRNSDCIYRASYVKKHLEELE